MPSVLHRQAEAHRHRRPRRALPPEVPEEGSLSLRDRLAEALQRAAEVERELSDPKTTRDPQRFASLGREHQRLGAVVELGSRIDKLTNELEQARELVSVDDPEMAAEARAEVRKLEEQLEDLERKLKPVLIPRDPLDDRPAIVEIRAGTGGDEAAIFAGDLFRMYTRFAEGRGWKIEMLS
ncbi:MAG: PCRF domain-containing protein, partial [Gemmatimonadaceae bacterium]|nr:PCRF domain-containing protein [Gemmatimonadaceae bacterium]